jgi:hypothetical protein
LFLKKDLGILLVPFPIPVLNRRKTEKNKYRYTPLSGPGASSNYQNIMKNITEIQRWQPDFSLILGDKGQSE